MTITITLDLTAKNWKILQQLLEDEPVGLMTPALNTAPVETPKAVEVAPVETPKPVDEQPKISAQDVKAVCLKMSKAGRQAELKAAFAKFGGKKLSDIAEADYPALMKELGDA